jgi:hypothetical protein
MRAARTIEGHLLRRRLEKPFNVFGNTPPAFSGPAACI